MATCVGPGSRTTTRVRGSAGPYRRRRAGPGGERGAPAVGPSGEVGAGGLLDPGEIGRRLPPGAVLVTWATVGRSLLTFTITADGVVDGSTGGPRWRLSRQICAHLHGRLPYGPGGRQSGPPSRRTDAGAGSRPACHGDRRGARPVGRRPRGSTARAAARQCPAAGPGARLIPTGRQPARRARSTAAGRDARPRRPRGHVLAGTRGGRGTTVRPAAECPPGGGRGGRAPPRNYAVARPRRGPATGASAGSPPRLHGMLPSIAMVELSSPPTGGGDVPAPRISGLEFRGVV